MVAYKNIKKIIEDVEIKFIPVKRITDGSIYGYKVIKEFKGEEKVDKEELYDLVFEENFFEFFLTKIKDRSLKEASEKGYLDKKFFYTLRVNYIKNNDFLFNNIESMLSKYNLSKENICFEIKGFENWNDIEELLDYVEDGYEILIKEGNQKLDRSLISLIEPQMIEINDIESTESIEMVDLIKGHGGKIIYKIKEKEEINEENLKRLGVDFMYRK